MQCVSLRMQWSGMECMPPIYRDSRHVGICWHSWLITPPAETPCNYGTLVGLKRHALWLNGRFEFQTDGLLGWASADWASSAGLRITGPLHVLEQN